MLENGVFGGQETVGVGIICNSREMVKNFCKGEICCDVAINLEMLEEKRGEVDRNQPKYRLLVNIARQIATTTQLTHSQRSGGTPSMCNSQLLLALIVWSLLFLFSQRFIHFIIN